MPTILYPAAIEELLHGPSGPVMRNMGARGEAIHLLARSKVRPSRVRTGRAGAAAWSRDVSLRDSGIVQYARIPGVGPVVLVRFRKSYAAIYNNGSKPHVIRPKVKQALAFYSTRLGTDVVVKSVNHPGTKPTHFLSGSIGAGSGSGVISEYVSGPILQAAADVSEADLRGVA